jgi:hypothetical protein
MADQRNPEKPEARHRGRHRLFPRLRRSFRKAC